MSRTTLDIDDELLMTAMRVTGLKTKTEVIERALHVLVREQARQRLIESLGTYDLDLDQATLEQLRSGE
jgi:Arc/MetJ family transcription regulator